MSEVKVYRPLPGVLLVEVPDGIPDTDDFGTEGGASYNRIYIGGGEYEFHSVPYGTLPPIKTGIAIDKYEVSNLLNVVETVGDMDRLCQALEAQGGSLASHNYAVFKKCS